MKQRTMRRSLVYPRNPRFEVGAELSQPLLASCTIVHTSFRRAAFILSVAAAEMPLVSMAVFSLALKCC